MAIGPNLLVPPAMMVIEATYNAGYGLVQVIEGALQLANRTGATIRFVFNGVELNAQPVGMYSDISRDELVRIYERKFKEANHGTLLGS